MRWYLLNSFFLSLSITHCSSLSHFHPSIDSSSSSGGVYGAIKSLSKLFLSHFFSNFNIDTDVVLSLYLLVNDDVYTLLLHSASHNLIHRRWSVVFDLGEVVFDWVLLVPLDGACTLASQCEGTGLICEKERCQCNAPWYTPCRTSCGSYCSFECFVIEMRIFFGIHRGQSSLCLRRRSVWSHGKLRGQYALFGQTMWLSRRLRCSQWPMLYVERTSSSSNGCEQREENVFISRLDKSLNAVCSNSSECWSNYCTSSRCACPSGYEPREDNSGCRT